jgi:trans-aconitate methyltransferase
MIDQAMKIERRNLRFQRMDINDLDFAEEFDVIFSNSTLHWVLDHRRLLSRARRALLPGRSLRFGFAGDGNSPTFFAVVREAMARAEFAGYFAAFQWPWYTPSVPEYESLMAGGGFAEFRVWEENTDRLFADAAEMTGWIDQPCLVPFLARVAEGDKPAFREVVVSEMVRRARRPGGRCFEACPVHRQRLQETTSKAAPS